jgi:hypothetical protein
MPAFADVRDAIDQLSRRYEDGFTDGFICPPDCARFAQAVLHSIEAGGGECPKIFGCVNGITFTWNIPSGRRYFMMEEDGIEAFDLPERRSA